MTVEATGEGVSIVYPIGNIETRPIALRKPVFEAIYNEGIETLDILIHKPERNEGDFDGFWVFRKIGDPYSRNPWEPVIKLTAGEWVYAIEDVETSVQYSATVRGFVLPDKISKMADPLVFETMKPERSVPRNVELQVVDPYTVHMTWDAPVQIYGHIAGYTIEWLLGASLQESVNISSMNFYDFTDLRPGRSIAVSICAHHQPDTLVKFDYVGTCSVLMKTTIPPQIQGMRKPSFEAIYYEDIRDLHISIHNPEDVIGRFGGFEILTKIGPPRSPSDWHSVVKLPADARKYEMEKLQPLLTHSVTVRGLILPKTFSVMADPLVFEIIHAGLSPF
ncbi:Oncosphere antigen A [Taenia solium]|eukprot:TsM_000552000 transcript=TsM_000552000 gene=TsM_000552000